MVADRRYHYVERGRLRIGFDSEKMYSKLKKFPIVRTATRINSIVVCNEDFIVKEERIYLVGRLYICGEE